MEFVVKILPKLSFFNISKEKFERKIKELWIPEKMEIAIKKFEKLNSKKHNSLVFLTYYNHVIFQLVFKTPITKSIMAFSTTSVSFDFISLPIK